MGEIFRDVAFCVEEMELSPSDFVTRSDLEECISVMGGHVVESLDTHNGTEDSSIFYLNNNV